MSGRGKQLPASCWKWTPDFLFLQLRTLCNCSKMRRFLKAWWLLQDWETGFSWSQVAAFSQWIRPQTGLMLNKEMIYNGIQGQPADTAQRLDNPDQLGIDGDISPYPTTPMSYAPCRTWESRTLRRQLSDIQCTKMQAYQELVSLCLSKSSVSPEEISQQGLGSVEIWKL